MIQNDAVNEELIIYIHYYFNTMAFGNKDVTADYVSTDGQMHRRTDGWMDGWTDGHHQRTKRHN